MKAYQSDTPLDAFQAVLDWLSVKTFVPGDEDLDNGIRFFEQAEKVEVMWASDAGIGDAPAGAELLMYCDADGAEVWCRVHEGETTNVWSRNAPGFEMKARVEERIGLMDFLADWAD